MPLLVRPTITYFAERGTRDGSSPNETIGVDTSGATRKFFVPWTERFLAAKAMLGWSEIEYTALVPSGLRRLHPLLHPDTTVFPGYWYANGVSSITGHKMIGKSTGSDSITRNNFAKAAIEIKYENLGYLAFSDDAVLVPGTSDPFIWPDDEYRRYVSIGETRTSTDYLQFPSGVIYYKRSAGAAAPSEKPIPFNTGTILTVTEVPVLWHRVPYDIYNPNFTGVPSVWQTRIWGNTSTAPYLGTVNKYTFMGYAAGTLLFSGVRMIPRKSDFVMMEWDVEFMMAHDPRGWNFKAYINKDAAAEWLFVARKISGTITYYSPGAGTLPDGVSLYNERDFEKLFQVF